MGATTGARGSVDDTIYIDHASALNGIDGIDGIKDRTTPMCIIHIGVVHLY